jgi:hypothetical protein
MAIELKYSILSQRDGGWLSPARNHAFSEGLRSKTRAMIVAKNWLPPIRSDLTLCRTFHIFATKFGL